MHRGWKLGIGVAGLAISFAASAQTLSITPALVQSSSPVENALRENAGHASTIIAGAGKALTFTYQASEPVIIFLVPLKSDKTFVPTDFVTFQLPQTDIGDVKIDLTVSPGWTPGERSYLLHILSKTKEADVTFTSPRFTEASFWNTTSASVRHFFTEELYVPSSYHAIHGYRILGYEFTAILGVLVLVIAFVLMFVGKKELRTRNVISVLLIGSCVYALRFSVDLLRFSASHVREFKSGTYDEAGSAYAIAEAIKAVAAKEEKPQTVYVCRSGTNFKEKLLRYAAYPSRVTPTDVTGATLAVVMDRMAWSLDTTIDETGSHQRIRCNDLNRAAVRLTNFPDGSILYSLPQ